MRFQWGTNDMTRITPTKLESLTRKRDQINGQIQSLRAREQARNRKEDTRRKILIGGAILRELKKGDITQEWLNKILNKNLFNERDRKLFAEIPTEIKRQKDNNDSNGNGA